MQATPPQLEHRDAPEGAWLVLSGTWTATALAEGGSAHRLRKALRQACQNGSPGWDLRSIERIDHFAAQALWRLWGRTWPERLELQDDQRSMLERIERFTADPKPPAPRPRGLALLASWVDALGRAVLQVKAQAAALVRLVGQLAIDALRALRHPGEAPWRDISGHLYQMGAAALPITALVGFLIGVVLAYLTSLQLRQFGAEAFIVNILGIALVRELGPMLGAILVAGRSGSAITAQIGVMRVTEELDAMRVLGISHGFRLVMPRAAALAIAMPLLAVWTTVAALAGGMLAADIALNITPAYFLNALPQAVSVANLTLAMLKSVVFGILIALVGCHYGLRVKPNTQSLGQGTTASVVTAITVVIIVDALFAVAFKDVGV